MTQKEQDMIQTYMDKRTEYNNLVRACKAYEERFYRENPNGRAHQDEKFKKLNSEMYDKEYDLVTYENTFPIRMQDLDDNREKWVLLKEMIFLIIQTYYRCDFDEKRTRVYRGLLAQLSDYDLYHLFMDEYTKQIRYPGSKGRAAYITRSAVHSVFFWLEHLWRDTYTSIEENDHYYINGHRYQVSGEGHRTTPCGGYLKTDDGRYDGTKDMECWCQGDIPETLRKERMKDNAVFV